MSRVTGREGASNSCISAINKRTCIDVLRKVQNPLLGERRREQLRYADCERQVEEQRLFEERGNARRQSERAAEHSGPGRGQRTLQALHRRLRPAHEARRGPEPAAPIPRLPEASRDELRKPKTPDERAERLQKYPASQPHPGGAHELESERSAHLRHLQASLHMERARPAAAAPTAQKSTAALRRESRERRPRVRPARKERPCGAAGTPP